MVRKLAEIMRRDEPFEWAGLRRTFGEQPSLPGANLFILGSAVDGGQQPADVAWRSAQRFVFGIVPPAEREWVWDWIVRRHTPGEWRRKRRAYALHRNRAWHDRVYRFAEFISKHLDGGGVGGVSTRSGRICHCRVSSHPAGAQGLSQ